MEKAGVSHFLLLGTYFYPGCSEDSVFILELQLFFLRQKFSADFHQWIHIIFLYFKQVLFFVLLNFCSVLHFSKINYAHKNLFLPLFHLSFYNLFYLKSSFYFFLYEFLKLYIYRHIPLYNIFYSSCCLLCDFHSYAFIVILNCFQCYFSSYFIYFYCFIF